MDLAISDEHKGLLKAQQELFPNTPHQRCICHFLRNVLSYVPYKEKPSLAMYVKQIFNSPTREMVTSIAQLIAQKYQESYPKVRRRWEEEQQFTLTYLDYPHYHWPKIRTTNLIEGVLNLEIRVKKILYKKTI